MEEDFSKFVHGFSITGVGIVYSAIMYYGAALLAVNLLGPALYGLYSLAFMVPNVAIYFLLFGLDVTAARYIAHNLGKNNTGKALKCAQTIFVVRIPVAIFSMIVFFLLSDPIAALLGEDIVLGLQLLSVFIFLYLVVRYLLGVLQGYFLFKQRTIAEAVLNTLLMVLIIPFVRWGFGYVSPILSFIFGLLVGIILSFYFLYRARIPVYKIAFEGIAALTEYLRFSFHVYISDSFYIAYIWVGTIVMKLYAMPVEIVGYYRAMFAITNTVIVISYGITIVLYPMLSELNARKEHARLAFGLCEVIKVTLGLSIPAAFGMLFISQPLVAVMFPKYVPAVDLLRIFSLRMIFLPLWSVLATALLTLERERAQAVLAVFLCGFSFVLSVVLGIVSVEGIALASTVGLTCAVVLQYIVLKRRIPAVSVGPVLKFCLSAAVMCGVVLLVLQLNTGDAVKIVLSMVCAVSVYTVLVLRTGAVTQTDLDLARSGLSAFGQTGKMLEPVLTWAQWIRDL
ncbi:MAG: oligosaccharide flippase family protein [Candidatus Methanofastidiosia archaeon]|jgi:O-antigen/teichoic acid export membrane protein